MKRSGVIACAAAGLAACASFAAGVVPVVSNVTMAQGPSHLVTVEYDLANGPAVVTLDIETNGPAGWASIGLENVYANADSVTGDANRKVAAAHGRILWRAVKAWPDRRIAEGGARAVVTAWPMDDTPDYMVVDMTAGEATADRVRYYASTNSLPGGGLFGNDAYRTTHLVLKKIVARDITWTMGSLCETGRVPEREAPHPVTLTNSYYLGVFPVTQKQLDMMYGRDYRTSFTLDGAMRIRDRVYYNRYQPYIRGAANWPDPPAADSLMGRLRALTGDEFDFDLPSEAQWEYAAKAGYGDNHWGGIAPMAIPPTDANHDATLPGRYRFNQETDGWWTKWQDWNEHAAEHGPGDGTPIAGSYPPNAFGLYDMFGGVWEWCLDWYQENITAYGGAVNANGDTTLDGQTVTDRVQKGGAWNATARACRPAYRNSHTPNYPGDSMECGFRVYCRAGLK